MPATPMTPHGSREMAEGFGGNVAVIGSVDGVCVGGLTGGMA
jgi:hypothetical protein